MGLGLWSKIPFAVNFEQVDKENVVLVQKSPHNLLLLYSTHLEIVLASDYDA